MYAFTTRLFVLTAVLLGAVASPVPDDHPDWKDVKITGINYAGSGCPAGSVAGTIDPNGQWLNVAFDKYSAEVWPPTTGAKGSTLGDGRKNCQITFQLQYPQGWSLTIFDTTYFGYIKLDSKVTAKQQSTYRWGGESKTATFYSSWVGKKDENYSFTDSLEQNEWVWSSCKGSTGTLVINTSISTDNGSNKKGSGLITTDSLEGKVNHVSHQYGCHWKKC